MSVQLTDALDSLMAIRGFHETRSPRDYGAIGDGLSHPASGVYASLAELQAEYAFATSLAQELDYLGWQAALNAGGAVESAQLSYVMANADPGSQTPLTLVSGRSWVHGHGARLSWPSHTAVTPDVHYLANPTFTDATGWVNASHYSAGQSTAVVFGSGKALCVDTLGDGNTPLFQFGQQVTLSPGHYRAVCKYTATQGAGYNNGVTTAPYATMRFYATSPGVGTDFADRIAQAAGLQAVRTGTVADVLEFDFEVTSTTTAWLTFTGGGWADFEVTTLDIVDTYVEAAVRVTRDGSPEHYPIMQPLAGVELAGPGLNSGLVGIEYQSYDDLDGNVAMVRDTSIQGFQTGVVMRNGAYLTVFENVNIFGNSRGVYFPSGPKNAGENLRFYGGGIYNNTIGIDNPGGSEMTLHSTALDYCTQAIVRNTGRIELHGVHAEMHNPSTLGKPLFECVNRGRILWYGGMFLGAGSIGSAPEPPLRVEGPRCSIEFYGTELYNLASSDYVVASGLGTIRAYGWQNNGNPNLGLRLVSRAPGMDVLASAGGFEVVSGMPFTGRLGDAGIGLEGGFWPDSGATVTDKWNSNHYTAAPSTDYARTGSRSLKVSKVGVGNGTSGQLGFLIPVQRGQDVLGEMYFLFPHAVGTGTVQLYHRLYWCRVVGYDSYGRPQFGHGHVFKGEVDLTVPLEGSSTWIRRSISSTYTTDESPASGAPEWATHLAVIMDHGSLPAMSYYIDDLIANAL